MFNFIFGLLTGSIIGIFIISLCQANNDNIKGDDTDQ